MENQDRSNNKNVSLSLIAEYGGSDSDSETESRSNTGYDDSDTTELSEMVLKNNIINACAHGPLNRAVDEDDDEYELVPNGHMIIDSQSGDIGYEVAGYREDNSDSETSSSSDSDSEVDSVKEIEEISSGTQSELDKVRSQRVLLKRRISALSPEAKKHLVHTKRLIELNRFLVPDAPEPKRKREEESATKASEPKPLKVNGELGIEDLPPIEDLAISLPAQETTEIGTIFSIVEQLVVVKATPGTPPVDLDTVLFLDHGAKALGKVFDVFGPVTEPYYAIRFNSRAHAAARGAAAGAAVYVAPRSNHTTYVFLPDLMKIKGSDASWKNDIEPPPNQVEYSDDEEERRARKESKQKYVVENENGENSKNTRKDRRGQRPSESSSRFGSGPSRGRNPFSAWSRRNNPNMFQRFARPFMDVRTPPPHPNDVSHFGAPPHFPLFPPFNPTPPPFMYQYPRLRAPVPLGPPLTNAPIFGAPYCNAPGPQPQWVNSEPPPPPGT